jgi:fatty acyl-CoA reductase
MPRLASLVHVSSSYVNRHVGLQVKEQIYPFPLGDPAQLFQTFDKMSDNELLDYERNVALKVFPNNFGVSMCMTEHLLQEWTRSMNLPVVIVRPSTVAGSISEPMPGWVEGMAGFTGTTVLTALGITIGLIGNEVHNRF